MDDLGKNLVSLIEQTRKMHSLPNISKDELYTVDVVLSASIVIAYLHQKLKSGEELNDYENRMLLKAVGVFDKFFS
jgi:hypothetical protein